MKRKEILPIRGNIVKLRSRVDFKQIIFQKLWNDKIQIPILYSVKMLKDATSTVWIF